MEEIKKSLVPDWKQRLNDAETDAVLYVEEVILHVSALERLGGKIGDDIRLCSFGQNQVHVFKGLEKLAFALRKTITYTPAEDRYDDYCGQMSFEYKGYKFFELWDRDGESAR